jgi:hypothetical protein
MLEHLPQSQSEIFPDTEQIPVYVREYASKHNVGMPLMPYHNSRRLLLSLIGRAGLVVGLIGVAGLCLKLYTDEAVLDQTFLLGQVVSCLTLLISFLTILYAFAYIINWVLAYRAYQQKLYLCQEGLLRLGGGNEEAIRWGQAPRHRMPGLVRRSTLPVENPRGRLRD